MFCILRLVNEQIYIFQIIALMILNRKPYNFLLSEDIAKRSGKTFWQNDLRYIRN